MGFLLFHSSLASSTALGKAHGDGPWVPLPACSRAGLSHPHPWHCTAAPVLVCANPVSHSGISSNTAPYRPCHWDHFNHQYPIFPALSCSGWPVLAVMPLPVGQTVSITQLPFSISVPVPLCTRTTAANHVQTCPTRHRVRPRAAAEPAHLSAAVFRDAASALGR